MRATALVFALVLAACSGAAEPSTGTAARPAIGTKSAGTNEDEGACGTGWDDAQLAASATAPFDQIDLQLDDTPTFMISVGLAGAHTFTRLPAFTLYRDGTVFYPDPTSAGGMPTSLVTAKLDRPAADDLRRHVLALGAEELMSHVDSCSCPKDSTRGKILICADDAGFVIVRFRDPHGALRQVVVYGGFWNKQAVAARVLSYLRAYRAPGATAYIPTKAVAVIEHREPGACEGPLDASLAKLVARTSPAEPAMNVNVLEGDALRLLTAKMPAGGGHAVWCTKDETIHAHLYPTLPGMDHRAAIAQWMRSLNP